MGLVKHLLFWPVTGPKALVDFSLRQIEGFARRELTDDEGIREELMLLQMDLESGQIDEEEYLTRESALMARLRDARAWRRHFGIEGEWAPLGFDPSQDEPDSVAESEDHER